MSDPFKYFRIEAREITEQLQSGLLELERRGSHAELTARLLRLAHTLKGAARVVKQLEVANLAHRFEDLLLPLRQVERSLTRDEIEALLQPIDAMASRVAALGPAPPLKAATEIASPAALPPTPDVESPGPSQPPLLGPDELARGASAPVEHVDALMDSVADLGFQLGRVRHALPSLRAARGLAEQLSDRLDPRRANALTPGNLIALRALANDLDSRLAKLEREASDSVDRAGRELGQVRDRVDQLRLIAASSIFGGLERTTRDAAVSLGKRATFEAQGGEVRLDADVLTAVERALVQAVRNAVAHGIEADQERARAGKPRDGRVTLEVQRHGRQIRFTCRDDGRGVNIGAVQREAERLGKLRQGTGHDQQQLLRLLLNGGISTTTQVSEVAGRGVGLDLIREALAEVGGSVELATEPGVGTRLTLSVPASMSALDALLVEVGGEQVALPMAAVAQALRVSVADLNIAADEVSLRYEGQLLPFVPLGPLLRQSSQRDRERAWTVLVLRGSPGALALGVDRILGSETVVVRLLPDSARLDSSVAGVTLDTDGNPRLFLDPDELIARARGLPAPLPIEPPQARSILVIDDSLTTRMLEQSILESAGYRVTLATSGEQGLELARSERFDLFLVDVEMPGMDGFSFVEQTRNDPVLSKTPAVLVTSRASEEDLARGRAAGASGHIAKGEFDQLDFLARIAGLMT